MLAAGRLRHRITLQRQQETQDPVNGAVGVEWVDVATVWAAIEPLSAREFIAAQSEQSEVRGRILIRYRADVNAKMRAFHAAKSMYYNIEGIMADRDSGLEYITLAVSEGVRYGDDL